MALQQILLGTGPDTPGADSLYSGGNKINSNSTLLNSTAGGAEIGYDHTASGLTAITVQAAIDEIMVGGAVPTNLADLLDVSDTLSPSTGYALTYDGVEWVATPGLGSIQTPLSPADGEILVWNGIASEWQAEANTGAAGAPPKIIAYITPADSPYTVDIPTANVIICNTQDGTPGNIVVNLAAGIENDEVFVKSLSSSTAHGNTVTINRASTDTVDNGAGTDPATSLTLYAGDAVDLLFEGNNAVWWII